MERDAAMANDTHSVTQAAFQYIHCILQQNIPNGFKNDPKTSTV